MKGLGFGFGEGQGLEVYGCRVLVFLFLLGGGGGRVENTYNGEPDGEETGKVEVDECRRLVHSRDCRPSIVSRPEQSLYTSIYFVIPAKSLC